jgi:hypothetical protein
MPGGKGKINEYNKSLTPEQRKASARRAAQAPRRHGKTIREIAQVINQAPAQKKAQKALADLGIKDEDMTNAVMIAASVFRAAFNGDMRAIEKWENYVGQDDIERKNLEIRALKARIAILENQQGGAAGIDSETRQKVEDIVSEFGSVEGDAGEN